VRTQHAICMPAVAAFPCIRFWREYVASVSSCMLCALVILWRPFQRMAINCAHSDPLLLPGCCCGCCRSKRYEGDYANVGEEVQIEWYKLDDAVQAH
jgi:hypothetical protein